MRLVKVAVEHGNDRVEAVTADIGPGGAFVRTNHPIPRGTTVPIYFQVPEGAEAEITGLARVVRTVERPGAGGMVAGCGVAWIRFHVDGDAGALRGLLDRYFGDADALPIPGGAPPPPVGGSRSSTGAPRTPDAGEAEALRRATQVDPMLPNPGAETQKGDGGEIAPENEDPRHTWQRLRRRALESARDGVENDVGPQPSTQPEVPVPRGGSRGGEGRDDEASFHPDDDAVGPRRRAHSTLTEWQSDPHGAFEAGGQKQAQRPTIDEFYQSGIPTDVAITYRLRSVFFVGRLRVIAERLAYVATAKQQPVAGSRIVLHLPMGAGPRVRTLSLITTVTNVDETDGDDPGGFEATIQSVDEKGKTGAFRQFLRAQADLALKRDFGAGGDDDDDDDATEDAD